MGQAQLARALPLCGIDTGQLRWPMAPQNARLCLTTLPGVDWLLGLCPRPGCQTEPTVWGRIIRFPAESAGGSGLPNRHARRFFAALGLAAYLLHATALAWSFVRCEEPGGRIVLEPAGDHSLCEETPAPGHGHRDADHQGPACSACSSCPCQDSPLGVELATSRNPEAALDQPRFSGRLIDWAGATALVGFVPHRLHGASRGSAVPGLAHQRCLRSVVLLL